MEYPNNDLWSVRQHEFLVDALKGYEGKHAVYCPDTEFSLPIPGIADYTYKGILNFEGQDRTIIFEQGPRFGLQREDIEQYLAKLGITYTVE